MRATRPRQSYEQRYRTVTVPVPTRVRVPMEPASVGPAPRSARRRAAPRRRRGAAPARAATPLETEGGDLFSLGTGYSYYLKPADWAYPPASSWTFPRRSASRSIDRASANESPNNPGGLIMRVNGRERDLKTVVRDGDVLEIDAQAHNIIDDVRRGGAEIHVAAIRERRRANKRIDSIEHEERRERWRGTAAQMADRGTSGHAVRDAQRAATAEFADEQRRRREDNRPGTDSSIRAITVNIYADTDDEDGSNTASTVTPTPRRVSPPARRHARPSPPAPGTARRVPPTTWPPRRPHWSELSAKICLPPVN